MTSRLLSQSRGVDIAVVPLIRVSILLSLARIAQLRVPWSAAKCVFSTTYSNGPINDARDDVPVSSRHRPDAAHIAPRLVWALQMHLRYQRYVRDCRLEDSGVPRRESSRGGSAACIFCEPAGGRSNHLCEQACRSHGPRAEISAICKNPGHHVDLANARAG